MKRSGSTLVLVLLLAMATCVNGAEPPAQPLAGRPYYSLFASSIDRVINACNVIFDSVERPDLAATLTERQKSYRDFEGIERTKPIGIMAVWGEDAFPEVVFFPVKNIDALLKTATFGVVGFHQVSPDRYEIERPGSPYHVLVRNNYAFAADSLSTIQALQITPEQLTRGFRDRYDLVLHLDLKQIPQPTKVKFVDAIRMQMEPWFQPQDNEVAETANLRKTIGKLTLELFQRAVLDTSTVTVGGRIDPKTRHLIFEVVVEATKGSALVNGLNRLVSQRSEFTSLISPDVPAGVALNLPLGGLVDQILGQPVDPAAKGKRLEAGIQLVGEGLGKLSLITALRGSEAIDLNNAIPHLILKLNESGAFASVQESFDVHQGVILHSLIPREMPTTVTQLVGSDVEILVGQGKQSTWLAIGQPATLPDRLKEAISLVNESSAVQTAPPLVRARFQASKLPESLVPDLLIPGGDPDASRAALAKGEDGFSLTLEPTADGIKLRIEAEEGFVRLVGRDWINQIEDSKRFDAR